MLMRKPPRQNPTTQQVKAAFSIMDRLFAQLRTGEIDTIGDIPVIKRVEGIYSDLRPPLLGWIDTWEFILKETGDSIDLKPLFEIYLCLQDDKPMTRQMVNEGEKVQRRLRHIYSQQDIHLFARIAQQRQTAYAINKHFYLESE
ncbi:hypothetical protein LIN78_11940 [Leeia sp. TBRC 13508]|uniref:Uncharacterized protein n=1 Tax=Leeia speluncae TaxID=2884804 RepID=A0ABS8D7T5_9NEIS|nr:hypothetical protein [Leeia speluncae]MCB6184255.1 hypothetical protein [Leeia speluncae]